MNRPPPGGLYALLDAAAVPACRRAEAADAALAGGARMLQYRDKTNDRTSKAIIAEVAAVCRRHAAPLIVNDDVDLALAIGADGVHLGGSDEDLGAARARLGNSAIIGATCHASLTRAAAAARAGADYLSFGRFFPSRTKPSASAAQPAVLGAAKGQFALPIVAIGGVNPHNGRALLAAGADWLCASHAVFGAADPATAAAMLAALFFQEEDRDRS